MCHCNSSSSSSSSSYYYQFSLRLDFAYQILILLVRMVSTQLSFSLYVALCPRGLSTSKSVGDSVVSSEICKAMEAFLLCLHIHDWFVNSSHFLFFFFFFFCPFASYYLHVQYYIQDFTNICPQGFLENFGKLKK